MTSQDLLNRLNAALAASEVLLGSLRRGLPPSDECVQRRGRLLQEIADAAQRAPAGEHSGEMQALTQMDAEILAAARLYKARLTNESLCLQKERAVLRFADGVPAYGSALDFIA